ncbi:MAG TPA: outer membrane beta-barrel protein [Edaphocola sp.]|nr:outer membrane beta-barrel protein [Edaphocola sp.]
MKYHILLTPFLGLISSLSFAQKKITSGIGLDIFQTKLNNVDRENFSGYGHSVPDFTQNDKLGFGINGIVRLPAYKGCGLETGLGLTRYSAQFHFDYFHAFMNRQVNEQFNINLNYLRIPLNLYYDFSISKKSSIIISGGINFKLLLWADDNFDEIVFEKIGLPKTYKRYQSSILGYNVNISYKYNFQNKKAVELGILLGADISKTVNRNTSRLFGFYGNLYPTYYSQYGISMKYFFTQKLK